MKIKNPTFRYFSLFLNTSPLVLKSNYDQSMNCSSENRHEQLCVWRMRRTLERAYVTVPAPCPLRYIKTSRERTVFDVVLCPLTWPTEAWLAPQRGSGWWWVTLTALHLPSYPFVVIRSPRRLRADAPPGPEGEGRSRPGKQNVSYKHVANVLYAVLAVTDRTEPEQNGVSSFIS